MAKHNERRRDNRAIRRHVVEWARRNGLDKAEMDRLEKAPPGEAKQWAKDRGLDPERFIDGVPDLAAKADSGGPDAGGWRPAQLRAAVANAPAALAGGAGRGGGGGGRPDPGAATGGGAGRGVADPEAAAPRRPAGQGFTGAERWSTPELEAQIRQTLETQGGHRDEAALLDGSCTSVVSVSGGTNETRKVVLDNGLVGYHKPFAHLNGEIASRFGQDAALQPVHEVAAWRLAERMGPPWSDIVPPCVLRNVEGELGSFALERPGRGMVGHPWDVPEWQSAAFFDALLGQQDRHPGNYLIAGNRITLIDHGYAFGRDDDIQNFTWLLGKRHRESPALTLGELELLNRIDRSPDAVGLRGVLAPDRLEAFLGRVATMRRSGVVIPPTKRALDRQEAMEMWV